MKVEPISLLNLSASSSRSGFPKALLTAVDMMSRNLMRLVGGLGLQGKMNDNLFILHENLLTWLVVEQAGKVQVPRMVLEKEPKALISRLLFPQALAPPGLSGFQNLLG